VAEGACAGTLWSTLPCPAPSLGVLTYLLQSKLIVIAMQRQEGAMSRKGPFVRDRLDLGVGCGQRRCAAGFVRMGQEERNRWLWSSAISPADTLSPLQHCRRGLPTIASTSAEALRSREIMVAGCARRAWLVLLLKCRSCICPTRICVPATISCRRATRLFLSLRESASIFFPTRYSRRGVPWAAVSGTLRPPRKGCSTF